MSGCEVSSNGVSRGDTATQAQISALQTALAAETAARIAGDAASQSAINNITLASLSAVVANFNFAGMASQNLTTGAHTLTSEEGIALPFVSFQQGATFDILNGTGLRFRANATSTTFPPTPGSRTAALLDFLLLDMFNAFDIDAGAHIIFTIFCRQITIPTTQSGAMIAGVQLVGIRPANTPVGGTADQTYGVNRFNVGGAQALRSFVGVTGSSNYTNPLPNAFAPANTNVLAMQLGDGGVHSYAGDWDPSATTWDQVLLTRDIAFNQANSAGSVFKDRSERIGVAFPTGQTSADMAIDIERLVVSLAA